MEIKICGPGCVKCNEALQVVQAAVAAAGVEAEVVTGGDAAGSPHLASGIITG